MVTGSSPDSVVICDNHVHTAVVINVYGRERISTATCQIPLFSRKPAFAVIEQKRYLVA